MAALQSEGLKDYAVKSKSFFAVMIKSFIAFAGNTDKNAFQLPHSSKWPDNYASIFSGKDLKDKGRVME